jgi:putative membrane protein
MKFLARLLISAAALWIAIAIVPGVDYSGPWIYLLLVALIFGLLNATLRPLLKALTCPLILLTLGLFTLVINAVVFWVTGALSRSLGLGFRVDGFLAAFLGALVVTVVSVVLSLLVKESDET